MDLLKKYWDKILLALALLGLITVAVWLMVSVEATLKGMEGGTRVYGVKGTVIKPLDTQPIAKAIETVAHPVACTFAGDPFETAPKPVAATTNDTRVTEPKKFTLEKVIQKPFKLLFKAYGWDPEKKEGSSFQINFQFRSRTFIIGHLGQFVEDLFEKTGFKVIGFQHKEALVQQPGIVNKVITDVSEITLQYSREDPILLVLGKEGLERESVATITCDPGWPSPSVKYEVRRGQQFKCGATTYIVVDITSRQMIIKDTNPEAKEPITIPLGGEGSSVSP